MRAAAHLSTSARDLDQRVRAHAEVAVELQHAELRTKHLDEAAHELAAGLGSAEAQDAELRGGLLQLLVRGLADREAQAAREVERDHLPEDRAGLDGAQEAGRKRRGASGGQIVS